jgi:hypothetical protein
MNGEPRSSSSMLFDSWKLILEVFFKFYFNWDVFLWLISLIPKTFYDLTVADDRRPVSTRLFSTV